MDTVNTLNPVEREDSVRYQAGIADLSENAILGGSGKNTWGTTWQHHVTSATLDRSCFWQINQVGLQEC